MNYKVEKHNFKTIIDDYNFLLKTQEVEQMKVEPFCALMKQIYRN